MLIVTSIISIAPSAAQADCRSWFDEESQGWKQWGEKTEKAGITIYSKEGPYFNKFKGIMEIDASREALVNLLYAPEDEIGECQKLFPKCKKARIVSHNCEEVAKALQDQGESYSLWHSKVD